MGEKLIQQIDTETGTVVAEFRSVYSAAKGTPFGYRKILTILDTPNSWKGYSFKTREIPIEIIPVPPERIDFLIEKYFTVPLKKNRSKK